MVASSHFSIVNKTRGRVPRLPFAEMKKNILGNSYDLSLALVGEVESKKITRKRKGKNTPSNVLSFPLSKDSGEIVLCLSVARTQAALYHMTPRAFIARLFIHGMLHLKGLPHGATMDHRERETLTRFRI